MNPNPYVGPRPFSPEDQDLFFGRDAEASALISLVAAQREVLVYSPAGAGKTSLLNARVIPGLLERGLTVLPLARLGAPLPPGVETEQVGNVFVYGALLSLFGEVADSARVDQQALLRQTLDEGLCALLDRLIGSHVEAPVRGRRAAPKPPAQVVIFDQAEELLTAHPERPADIQGFFDQLRETLEAHPRLGVVFSMREDYLAALEPYLNAIAIKPGWAHFRLEALSAPAALEAVTRPALLAGVPFAEGLADQLVGDLRRTSGLPGAVKPDPPGDLAPAVEPVLLQVVCSQLWANLPDGALAVTESALPRSGRLSSGGRRGTLNQALTDYYETAVRAASAVGGVAEVEVRRWFSQVMITPQGTRGMASQDLLETGGLSNLAVLELEDLHLLVSHVWAGTHWYELAQEIFIEPIRASNQACDLSRETALRKTARLWKASGEHGLLYYGGALKAARAWADSVSLNGPGEVEPYEWEFIQAAEKAEHANAALRGWIVVGALGLILLSVVLGLLTFSSRQRANLARESQNVVQKERATAVINAQEASQQRAAALLAEEAAQNARADAQRQAQISLSREHAALGSQAMDQNLPQTALLLGLQSVRESQLAGELRSVAGEQTLRDALGKVSGIPLQGHTLGVNNLAASSDRRWLATVSDDGSLRLWNLASVTPGDNPIVLNPGQGWLSAVAFSPDGRWLAASGADSKIRVWDMAPANTAATHAEAVQRMEAQAALLLEGHSSSIEGLRFSPDGHWLVSGSADKTVRLWDITKLPAIPQPVTLTGPVDLVILVDITADSRWVAAGARDGSVWVWDLTAKDVAASLRRMSLDGRINDLAFSPDGRWLAAGGVDHSVVLWDMRLADPAAQPQVLGQHNGAVSSLAFSPDGCWLASGGADNRIFLWFMGAAGANSQPGQPFYALTGHTGEVDSLAFPKLIGPRENYQAAKLASGGADNTVRVWDLSPVMVSGKDCRRPLDNAGQALAMPDERITDISGMTLRGLNGPVLKLDFVAGNRWLAAAGADGSARLWDLRTLSSSVEPFQYDTTGVGKIYADAISSDGHWLAAAGEGGVFTWSLQGGQAAPQPVGCTDSGAYSIVAGTSGAKGWMAAGCLSGSVVLWNTRQMVGTGGLQNAEDFMPQRLEGLSGVIYAVALSPDGQWLAAGDENGTLMLWKLAADGSPATPLTLATGSGPVYSLLFDARGRWLAAGDAKGHVRLWDLATGAAAPLGDFQATSGGAAYVLAQSPDSRWLAAGTWDRTGVVRLWDMDHFAAGIQPAAFTLGGFINRVYALAFSPDGHWLAAGSADFTLRQWDLTRLAALNPVTTPRPDPKTYSSLLDDHKDLVFQAVYSQNSRWLLSASADGTLRQWDTLDPLALPVVFEGHSAWVRMLALTPNGRYVISASEDGTLRRWALSLDDLQRAACQMTRRSLTPAEVTRYLHGTPPEPVCAAYNP